MKNVSPFLSVALAVTWATTAWAGSDIALERLPAAVRATIERETRQGIVEDVEYESTAAVPHYEVEYSLGGEEWELDVAEDGQVLRNERD